MPGKDTRSKGDPIEERKRNNISGLKGAFLICIALSSAIVTFSPLVSADKEPNDHIEDAETLKVRTSGIVDLEPMSDIDHYKVEVSSNGPFRLKLTLVGDGLIQLYTTPEPDGTGFVRSITVDSFSPTDEVLFSEGDHGGIVFCFVQGKGAYILEVLSSKDKVEVNGPSKELIIFLSLGAFLLVFLLLISTLFIKMIKMRKEDEMDRALKTEIPYDEANEQRCFRSDFELDPSPYSIKGRTARSGDVVCYTFPKGENGRRLVTPVEEWDVDFEEDPY